jgi:hypothetical protein
MITKLIRPSAIILLITFAISVSCRKQIGDVVKVPDFKTLNSQFSEPPAEYTTAPFFVWNADITREEIDNFLTDFVKQGSKQVFVHPRPGLITEYLSQKWFDLFRYTVDKGRELGMKVWIYDENSYPSGFAGGHVPAEMPESFNQGQGLKMTRLETLPDTADKYHVVLKEENGKFSDITSVVDEEKGKPGKYLLFSKTYYGRSDWYGGFPYVDLLYKGVTDKFIGLTMTGYEKIAGNEFGITVPGTFTDEPQINSPGGIRYTPDLFDQFREKWGYDLKISLPSLFEETGDWKKVRHNYTGTLLDLFVSRWAVPWYEYCNSKGLIFTGHYWEHEWPNMRMGGDNMAMYIYHHVPAVDMLFNQFNDSTPNAQFGNVRAIKELASAANQAGRNRKLSETYGGSGWDLTFTEMKRNGDWEYALGVNLMNQHLTFFSMQGARKYDYPPTFDYHEPWWNNYKYINDHYARLSLALSAGKQVNDILVIEPTTTSWLYDSYVKRNPKVAEIGQSFQSFITKLEKEQVEYDLGSENIINSLGSAGRGKLVVGNAEYSTVILPPLTENLNSATFNLLKKFVSSGGTLIAFSAPTLIDGNASEELSGLFASKPDKIINASWPDDKIIKERFLNNDLSFSRLSGGQLYHHTRILRDGKLVFLVNSSLETPLEGRLSAIGADAYEMNTLTGTVNGYRNSTDGNRITLDFSLPRAGSLLLFIPSSKGEGFPVPTEPLTFNPLPASSPMTVKRIQDNALTIDFCDVILGNETSKDLHVFTAADKIYRYFGIKNGNPWNHSVQYRTNIIDKDTFGVKTGFTALYHFTVKGNFDYSNLRAVVERPWLWTVSLNGKKIEPDEGKWWLDRSFGVFAIGSLVKLGDNTLSVTATPMKIHAEVEPVYILGDFSVEPAPKGWIITNPAREYRTGSWLTQGLPFYSWEMSYSKEFEIEKTDGKFEVALGDWKGTVAEVYVNGKIAGIIAFPPYRTDITPSVEKGRNVIEVRVTGSLRNLQGPHHNNPPAGLSSPWNWRNVKSYPAAKDYLLFDYGLMGDFTLQQAI